MRKMTLKEHDPIVELGWKDGTVAEFLGLSPEESALIEIKLALGKYLKQRRKRRMSQAQLAERLNERQSEIASAESGQPLISIDLLVRAMLTIGATPQEIGQVIAGSEVPELAFA